MRRIFVALMVTVVLLALTALVVGGVGILNIMLVSVRERPPEIGIRKALGARSRQILDAFLSGALAISLCGGLIGILIGGGPVLVNSVFHVPIPLSAWSVAFALLVSVSVGVFFGYYPPDVLRASIPWRR